MTRWIILIVLSLLVLAVPIWLVGCFFCLVLVIAKWRFTGEFSKAGMVTFAVGLVLTVTLLFVN